jgi:hypothetical protein
VSNMPSVSEQVVAPESSTAAPLSEQALAAPTAAASQETLDEVENIDFLLEEIENKIAPLALA